jgi:16S rRNA processing protein RimM
MAAGSGSASREGGPGLPDRYDPETLPVGVLGRPHGVHGEMMLRPHDRSGRALDRVRRLLLVVGGRPVGYDVTALRPVAGGYLVRLAGVGDREAAAALTLAEVRVPRAVLPPLGPGEYYVEDVVGCAVDDETGRPLGVVRGTFWNGAHDVATVIADDGRERMIPLVPDFVLAVDAPGRRLHVRWDDADVD